MMIFDPKNKKNQCSQIVTNKFMYSNNPKYLSPILLHHPNPHHTTNKNGPLTTNNIDLFYEKHECSFYLFLKCLNKK